MKHYFLFLVFCLAPFLGKAQQPSKLESIVGIVGDRIILKSDIETAFADAKRQNPGAPVSKCEILEQSLGQKILAEQAERDSLEVSDEEIEGVLENRIRSFIERFGSEKKLEEVSGKSVYQLKDEYRPVFREQLKAQRMQQQLMSKVVITPQEVKAFYEKMPKDSLPYYPSTVEIGQIILAPKVSQEVEEYARKKLEGIRKDIVEGKSSFEIQAGIYSEDPGSKDNGGDLGLVTREQMVPEFSAAAFRLKTGEISKIVKTEYGYHIIEMVARQGENAHLRHILVKPLVTSGDIKKTIKNADSLRAELMAGKITFSQAVKQYSADKQSKMTGGIITNPYTGSTFLEMSQLDASATLAIKDLEVGKYSQPHEYTSPTGDKSVRIIYLRSLTKPHLANLEDDYGKIQGAALAEKQNEYLFQWLERRIPTFYIKVDKEFHRCPNVGKWVQAAANN